MNETTVLVEPAPLPPVAARRIEICEHKGIGHPDSLTDGACEAAAVALAAAYRRTSGAPRHFNVDKGLLIAGRSAPRFGGGRILVAPKLVICGRAADSGGKFDVPDRVTNAARRYLLRTLRQGADEIRIECEVRPGSPNLEAVYAEQMSCANDTSFGVGFWPYSPLERLVLEAAALLRSDTLHERFPAAGDDFKIMGMRRDHEIALTVGLAMLDRAFHSPAEYFATKLTLAGYLSTSLGGIAVAINTLDDPKASDESGLYLTVTGLSAEMGDDGQVGRGNRMNGLITPARPMSLEAVSGKNPVRHVGKIYNVLASQMARAVCEEVDGVLEANVQLVSQIGRPVDAPWAASVQVAASTPVTPAVSAAVRDVVARCLEATEELSRLIEAQGVFV